AVTGAVLSMLTSLTVALALLPARSVTVKVWAWLAPSAVKGKLPLSVPSGRPGGGALAAGPRGASAFFHPFGLGGGGGWGRVGGAVVSMLTSLTAALALLPARSVTVKVWDWLAPSAVKVKLPLSVPSGSPERASLAA